MGQLFFSFRCMACGCDLALYISTLLVELFEAFLPNNKQVLCMLSLSSLVIKMFIPVIVLFCCSKVHRKIC